jgi:hypothetical protein
MHSPDQSLGQRRVRASFNPSEDSIVDDIKAGTAKLIDLCDRLSGQSSDQEVKRLYSLAQTHFEGAAMWAVKAATAGK